MPEVWVIEIIGEENPVGSLRAADAGEGETFLKCAFDLRAEVFLREVGRDREVETDEEDETAVHLVLVRENAVIGTLRLYWFDPVKKDVKIGRVAVVSSLRGSGLGRVLMQSAHALASKLGCITCYLHAEMGAAGFYDRLGYRREGDVFMEAGLAHQRMSFTLMN